MITPYSLMVTKMAQGILGLSLTFFSSKPANHLWLALVVNTLFTGFLHVYPSSSNLIYNKGRACLHMIALWSVICSLIQLDMKPYEDMTWWETWLPLVMLGGGSAFILFVYILFGDKFLCFGRVNKDGWMMIWFKRKMWKYCCCICPEPKEGLISKYGVNDGCCSRSYWIALGPYPEAYKLPKGVPGYPGVKGVTLSIKDDCVELQLGGHIALHKLKPFKRDGFFDGKELLHSIGSR